MTVDPRAPVIVGAGQLLRRPEDAAAAPEPIDMMRETLERAALDSGAPDLLRAADSIRVVQLLSWRYPDPARFLADRLGASPRETVLTTTGGNSPQMLVNETARAIQAGELDVALLVGAEAMFTRSRARRQKVWLEWTTQEETSPTQVLGDDQSGSNDIEMSRALALPTQIYPIFENAIRAASGASVADHSRHLAELWSRFSAVAATNPYAWSSTAQSAEEIGTVTADNRMIGFPYTKAMNANLTTDQAAGVIMCSAAAADAAGVPRDRWVFPWSGADGHDHYWVSERADLHSSPAIRLVGRATLELADTNVDEIAHVDLYSCFPSAVQIGAAELGLGLDRQLTVTGGLSFGGGPGNNYSMHAIATMVDVLRRDPGALGLVTSLGWYITKHAIGVYGTEPPPSGHRCARPQDAIDALPRRAFVAEHEGDVTVESYTVMHERDGRPSLGIVACRLPDDRRAWANVRDADVLRDMTAQEQHGRRGRLSRDGTLTLS
jgi:acetyl-CoA C-acetyltransferase